jgi:RNA-directed DNA polymerase
MADGEASRGSAVPEGARQEPEARDPKWSWVEASIWTDRMISALGNGVQGGKWFSLVDKAIRPATLEAAWRKVSSNRGAAGVDGVSIERFGYLSELGNSLRERSYRPSPIRRVEIQKSGGKTRPLGIPTVKDRIVQTALKMAIEPIFEAGFREGSYGFRPGRGAKDALREVDRLVRQGFTYVVDADLKSCFDTIPHDRLMARVKERISDGAILSLIAGFLEQDIMSEAATWTPVAGTPQGGVLSPLLANVYLHPLDLLMEERGRKMARYADDFVILCRNKAEAEAALREIEAWTAANGLTLHPDKTHIGDCTEPGQGFEFLGYRFEAGRRYPRRKSRLALRDGIRTETRRNRGDPLERIIADLNPKLRGWFEYFKHGAPAVLEDMDGFVRRRLRALLRKREKRPGAAHSQNDHRKWTNAFFARQGLFTMTTAHAAARHPR